MAKKEKSKAVDAEGNVTVLLKRKVQKGYLEVTFPLARKRNIEAKYVVDQRGGCVMPENRAIELVRADPINFKIKGMEHLSKVAPNKKRKAKSPKRRPIPMDFEAMTLPKITQLASEYKVDTAQNRMQMIAELEEIRDGGLQPGSVAAMSDEESEDFVNEILTDGDEVWS